MRWLHLKYTCSWLQPKVWLYFLLTNKCQSIMYIGLENTLTRKYVHFFVKNHVSITRWRHRTNTRCWRNDGARKENLHFDNQSWQVVFLLTLESLAEFKKAVETLVPTAFLILPNLHSCSYNSIETGTCFQFLNCRLHTCKNVLTVQIFSPWNSFVIPVKVT